jgi:hypothetical protein
MSYREEGDQVVLTISRDDYDLLLILLGASSVHAAHGGKSLFTLDQILGLLNRLNQGNPRYTPYQVEEKKS